MEIGSIDRSNNSFTVVPSTESGGFIADQR